VNKVLVILLWILLPAPLAVLLALPAAGNAAAVLGLILGAAGYVWLAGQLVLAARPRWLNDSLGTKLLWSFHGLMAVVAWLTIFFHRMQMGAAQIHGDPWQSRAGTLAWLGYFGLIGLAIVFMAPGPWAQWPPVKALRKAATAVGLTYARLRLVHRLNLVLTVLIVVHVLWAGPMAPDKNPGAFALAAVWALVCLGLYAWSKRPARQA
jgi:predicted ferric reductase